MAAASNTPMRICIETPCKNMMLGGPLLELRPLRYQVSGKDFTGFLADGSNGKKVPGILVAHEGGGFLTDHPKERARMIAQLGYVAFALDLFGDPRPTLDEARAMVQQLRADLPSLRARVIAALELLKQQPNVDGQRIGAVGYCFGGTAVLELARSGADVACTVGFHAGLSTTAADDAKSIRGAVLVCQGSADPIITAGQRDAFAQEMSGAQVDWQMHLYGGVGHSFTNPAIDAWKIPGFAYDASADQRSFRVMRDLFIETLESKS
jgi:dienelactone hydrolase